MTVTVIEPTAALVVVDLQEGHRKVALAHSMDDVVRRSGRLAAAFRDSGRPVVLVTVGGRAPGRTDAASPVAAELPDGFEDPMPEIGPYDHHVSKQRWGAFTGTDLDATLARRGVQQVVLTGVATSAGVESTARSAYELGYHVVLAVDAMTDRNATAHQHSVEHVFPKLGETGTTEDILALT